MSPTRAAVADVVAALVVLLCASVAAPHVAAAPTPDAQITLHSRAFRQGEVVVVRVAAAADTSAVTVTAFGAEWPAVRADDGRWESLIGIDLDTRPGTYELIATMRGMDVTTARRSVTVVARRFRTRTLTVAPDFVNPPPEVMTRIDGDRTLLDEVFGHGSTTAAWRGGFARPVQDRANSSFGTRSVFNGEPRNPHTGTDFLSPRGRPVRAPASGRVVVARDLFFTGNTVVIDHGLGVFSTLAHLSRIDVREGDPIGRGDLVGLVGATGRVTGPHLHWSLRVGAARVDPLSALAILPPPPR